ncbi:hypothetical protein G6717_05450 [Polynucleobacter paneuropaeus]|nr:hypothetical protein [Polynucleobacter paneuropaeus]
MARNYSAVMQEAAYSHPNVDITNDLIALLTQEISLENFKKSAKSSAALQKVAILNAKKIFDEWSAIPRESVAYSGNKAINKFANDNKIDIVFQTAAYVSPALDITEAISSILKQSPPSETAPSGSLGGVGFGGAF